MKNYLKSLTEQKNARDKAKVETARINQVILTWLLAQYYEVVNINGFDSDYTTILIAYDERQYKALQTEFKHQFDGIDFSIYTSDLTIEVLDPDNVGNGLDNTLSVKQSCIKLVLRHTLY
jgi:hypothetical protein